MQTAFNLVLEYEQIYFALDKVPDANSYDTYKQKEIIVATICKVAIDANILVNNLPLRDEQLKAKVIIYCSNCYQPQIANEAGTVPEENTPETERINNGGTLALR